MHAMMPLLQSTDFPALQRGALDTLQVNLGYKCNQNCLHCHVNAGPNRTEIMDMATIHHVLDFIDAQQIKRLDLTGGAPELNPHFKYLITEAKQRGLHIIDRCNLTVLEEPGQEQLADFLAQHQVEIVASMPCYEENNVDAQRGKGVYSASIKALQKLNVLGYGKQDSKLPLNLMYNPTGAFLPPSQQDLQNNYQRELKQRFGIEFNQLLTLTNMPISRFGSTLVSKGQFDDYMQLLKTAYQTANLETVMCKSLISIDWQGYVYDCDFNQMLNLPLHTAKLGRPHIKQLLQTDFEHLDIVIADHCYGCTAGQGSSCGGALS